MNKAYDGGSTVVKEKLETTSNVSRLEFFVFPLSSK